MSRKAKNKQGGKTAIYKNVLEVVGRINQLGYKLSRSTAYNHNQSGTLRPNKDGLFTDDIIKKYIARANLKKKDGTRDQKIEEQNSERQNAETRRINAQAEREELKLRRELGLYIPKESMERELSYRAMVFKMDGDSFCRSEAGAIIELVSGDKDKIPDLQEFLLERFHKWLARYAADKEFTVPQPAAAEMISDTDDENSELVDGE